MQNLWQGLLICSLNIKYNKYPKNLDTRKIAIKPIIILKFEQSDSIQWMHHPKTECNNDIFHSILKKNSYYGHFHFKLEKKFPQGVKKKYPCIEII